jgi:protein SCO1/2
MSKDWSRWLLFVGLSLAFLGAAVVLRTLRAGPAPAGEPPSVTEIRDDAPLPSFVLTGPGGQFSNADLAGQWSFVFFGYTQCPDICPTALTLMKEVKSVVAGRTGATPTAPFRVVFVSVDQRRDTRQLLDAYMAAFDSAFVGVTGDDTALAPLTRNLGVYYKRNDDTDKKHYTVDHSAAIYLIDPKGRLRAVFSSPQVATKVAANYQRIVLN